MTAQASTNSFKHREAPPEQSLSFNGVAENGQQAVAGWLQSNEVFMKGGLDIARDLMSFGQTRLEADLNAMKTLMACRTFDDITKFQRQFAEKAARQYLDQANKLTSHLTSFLTEATARGGAERPRR